MSWELHASQMPHAFVLARFGETLSLWVCMTLQLRSCRGMAPSQGWQRNRLSRAWCDLLGVAHMPLSCVQVQEGMQAKGAARRKSVERLSPAQRLSLRRSIRSHGNGASLT